MARLKKWGTYTGDVFNAIAEKELEALEWLISNITDEAMGSVDPTKSVSQILVQLNKDHGHGYLDPENFKETTLDQVDFPINKNPKKVFFWIDKQLAILSSCGGTIDDVLTKKIVIRGLNASILVKSVFPQNELWFHCKGHIHMANPPLSFQETKNYV